MVDPNAAQKILKDIPSFYSHKEHKNDMLGFILFLTVLNCWNEFENALLFTCICDIIFQFVLVHLLFLKKTPGKDQFQKSPVNHASLTMKSKTASDSESIGNFTPFYKYGFELQKFFITPRKYFI